MNQENVKILFGDQNIFEGICNTPLVNFGAESDGWWKTSNRIVLEGQILCCGLELPEIFGKVNLLKKRITGINGKSLSIIDSSSGNFLGIGGNDFIFVKSVNFDNSDHLFIIPFSIELEAHNHSAFAGNFRVTDPVVKSGSSTLPEGKEEFFIEVSAKGLQGDKEAFYNARDFCEKAVEEAYITLIPTVISCDANGRPRVEGNNIKSEELSIDYNYEDISWDAISATYKIVRKYIIGPEDNVVIDDPEDPDNPDKKYFVTYQYSVNASASKDSISVTISGSVRSDSEEGTNAGFLARDWSGIAQSWGGRFLTKLECTSVLSPQPSSKSNSMSSDGKTLSFSLTYRSIPCDQKDDDENGTGDEACGTVDTSVSYSASGLSSKSEESSFSLSVTHSARGTCGTKEERRAWAEEKISKINQLSSYEGVPAHNWKLVGTGRENFSDGMSINFEYTDKKTNNVIDEDDNPDNADDVPCDIEGDGVDGTITETFGLPQFNFKRSLCPTWLAIPNGRSFNRKTANLSVKYKGSYSSANNYVQSLLEGPGELIKSIIIHNDKDKIIQYEYEWEDASLGETVPGEV